MIFYHNEDSRPRFEKQTSVCFCHYFRGTISLELVPESSEGRTYTPPAGGASALLPERGTQEGNEVAIMHLSCKTISRPDGRSSVASAAYRSGQSLVNEQDGRTHDYEKKGGVEYSEIEMPENAPEWMKTEDRKIRELDLKIKETQTKINNLDKEESTEKNQSARAEEQQKLEQCQNERNEIQRDLREKIWNEVEKVEKGPKARTAREIEVALPNELTREQQKELMREYVKENFTDKGMVADWAIHDKGDGNPHCHILLTTREMDREGKWKAKSRKEYDLDKDGHKIKLKSGEYKSHKVDLNDWNKTESLEKWRENWAKDVNRELERHGHEARIDHRSNQERGLDREPTIHEGPARGKQDRLRKKDPTAELDVCKKNRKIKERNAAKDKEQEKEIAEFKKLEKELYRREKNVEKLIKRASKIKDKVHVRTEQGAEKAQQKNQSRRADLKTGLGVVEKTLAKINRELDQKRKQLERIKTESGKGLTPEQIRAAAVKKYLGKEISDELKQLRAERQKIDSERKDYERELQGCKECIKGTKIFDFKEQQKNAAWREKLQKSNEQLTAKEKDLERREAEHKSKGNEKIRQPEAKEKIKRIEERIKAVVQKTPEKAERLAKEVEILSKHRDKYQELKKTIEPRIKELGNVEIVIKGPMTRTNFANQLQGQVSQLLRDRPAPAKPRGHTKARVLSDDDDPFKKRGKGAEQEI